MSIQKKIRKIQQSNFIGREDQLSVFGQMLKYDCADEHFKNVIYVRGQGGVGKTCLLNQFDQILKSDHHAKTAYIDEKIPDVVEAVAKFCDDFEEQGFEFKAFRNRYQVYQAKLQELGVAADKPQDPSLLNRSIKAGLYFAKGIPGIGPFIGGNENTRALIGYCQET